MDMLTKIWGMDRQILNFMRVWFVGQLCDSGLTLWNLSWGYAYLSIRGSSSQLFHNLKLEVSNYHIKTQLYGLWFMGVFLKF